ncbi:hypothetical protein HUB97_08270 [Halorubraceae archaeon YAN]|nr:hypothetical protein [Halorubraceae archaeon YAN]
MSHKFTRRAALKAVAGGALGTALAGCATIRSQNPFATDESPTPQTVADPLSNRPQFRYKESTTELTRVDLRGHGIDQTGETSVADVIESAARENRLLELPPGEYLLDRTVVLEDFQRLGIRGNDATIRPATGTNEYLFMAESPDSNAEFWFEDLTFDLSESGTGGRALQARVDSELFIKNINVIGTLDSGPNVVRLDVTDADGHASIDQLRLPDGALPETNISGCYVGNTNEGDLHFRECVISGFPDNGLYADPPDGSITVDGGYFSNNGISNIRVNGGSLVRGAHVRCDQPHPGTNNMRGIRLTDYNTQPETEPAIVDGCRVEMYDITHSDGAIELSSQLWNAVIRNTYITVDVDELHAIRVKPPRGALFPTATTESLVCENVVIDGSAAGGAAVLVADRDNTTFDNISISQSGADRHGIEFRRSTGHSVAAYQHSVTGESLLLDQAEVSHSS